MNRRVVLTDRAPKPVGPYSQAIVVNGFVFVAGQVPIDPSTGKVVEGGIKEQTRRVLENVKAVLEAAGSSLDRVVKVNVYLKKAEDFAAMNEVYSQYFPMETPARTTVVTDMVREEFLIEIDVIALAQ